MNLTLQSKDVSLFKMEKSCFYCDLNWKEESNTLFDTPYFYVRYSDFPVTEGHVEVVHKKHEKSIFNLTDNEAKELNSILIKSKELLDKKFKPDGYNVGANYKEAAGQSQFHLHMHIIPRYKGDVENPKGGVRNVIPKKGDYTKQLKKKFPKREKYIK